MTTFKVEIQMVNGDWKDAGKLAEFKNGKWVFPTFLSRKAATAALTNAYDMDQYIDCSRVVAVEDDVETLTQIRQAVESNDGTFIKLSKSIIGYQVYIVNGVNMTKSEMVERYKRGEL